MGQAKANKGRIVVQPKDAQAAQVTIDTDKDTKVQVLRMWSALAPYDVEIQKDFEATEKPDGWGGLGSVPSLSHAPVEVGRSSRALPQNETQKYHHGRPQGRPWHLKASRLDEC